MRYYTRSLLLLPLLLLQRGLALAESKPLEFAQSGLKVSVANAAGKSPQISIHYPAAVSSQVFPVEDPPRLVVDLTGLKGTFKKSLGVTGGELISTLRFGTHPDKVRLVIDFTTKTAPAFKTAQKPGALEIHLGDANESVPSAAPTKIAAPTATSKPTLAAPSATATAVATSAPATTASNTPAPAASTAPTIAPSATATKVPSIVPSATASAAPTRIVAPTKTPTATPPPTNTPTPAATKVPTKAPTVAATAAPTHVEDKQVRLGTGSSVVSAIAFDYAPTDHSPIVRVTLPTRLEFKLSKKDDKTYQIIIPDSRLASRALTLAQFPPQDFVGFTYVSGAANESSVELSVGVERGIRISAFAKDNEIWIKTLNR